MRPSIRPQAASLHHPSPGRPNPERKRGFPTGVGQNVEQADRKTPGPDLEALPPLSRRQSADHGAHESPSRGTEDPTYRERRPILRVTAPAGGAHERGTTGAASRKPHPCAPRHPPERPVRPAETTLQSDNVGYRNGGCSSRPVEQKQRVSRHRGDLPHHHPRTGRRRQANSVSHEIGDRRGLSTYPGRQGRRERRDQCRHSHHPGSSHGSPDAWAEADRDPVGFCRATFRGPRIRPGHLPR